MKRKIKIIPFLISIFIVVVAVTGICLYSYYQYPNNKLRFMDTYFHENDHNKYATTDLIENALKWQTNYYTKNPGTLKYRDPVTKNEYSAPTDTTSTNYYKDGTMHIEGFFDIDVYAGLAYDESTEVWAISYYFFFYNIVYKTKDYSPGNIYLIFVEGTGEGAKDPDDDESVDTGDTALRAALIAHRDATSGGATPAARYSTAYSFASVSSTYGIFDNKASNPFANDDTENFVWYLAPKGNMDNTYKFNDLESATFAIIYEKEVKSSGASVFDVLVEGTFEGILDQDEYVEYADLTDTDNYNAYARDIYAAGYGKIIWPRIFLHGAIALVVSGVVAAMFYLIFQEEPVSEKDNKNKYAVKNKKNKPQKKK